MRKVQPIFQNPFEAFNPLKQLDHYLFMTARRFNGAEPIEAAAQRWPTRRCAQVGLSLAEVQRPLSARALGRPAAARGDCARAGLAARS